MDQVSEKGREERVQLRIQISDGGRGMVQVNGGRGTIQVSDGGGSVQVSERKERSEGPSEGEGVEGGSR